MHLEARKLHIVEELLKIDSNSQLLKVEKLLSTFKHGEKKLTINDFVGIFTEDEAAEFKKVIVETIG